ncbi:ectoine synthase [Paenibacillus sp.]|uniref:ectoine synthase n=1 Tax=Paenibacillus sp. TaxID=58172 RepID=UPI002D41996F|nr:ectoine synthase [Paenibacillus sp.]HZG87615.1 ectoine synthase [Paenibacillus sp.]
MIVRNLKDIRGTDRDVKAETWESRRLILNDDGVGFSLHDTVLYAGTSTDMWYKHHIEAVYCIEGEATLTDKETGRTYEIVPGTMYLLDKHDRHRLDVKRDLRVVCVFNPPCTGRETHDEDGAYPLLTT